MRSRLDAVLCGAFFALALALRWPLLHTPPYGDEGLHYWLARHLMAVAPNVSDLEGLTWRHPGHLVFQRPFYYLAMHPFALQGFTAFRVGHMLFASLLPVAAFGILRAHGAHRATAIAGGIFAAAYPLFAVWGGLGLMDEPMTVLVGFGWWARVAGRPVLSAGSLLLAVWTKETAVFALVALTAWTALAGWVAGRNRVRPFELDDATAPLAVACAVALLPITVAFSKGLGAPGAVAGEPYGAWLVDSLAVTPWFLAPIAAGLLWRRTRGLSALALFLVAVHLALHVVLHRDVEVWYLVLPAFVSGLAALLAVEEGLRLAWGSPRMVGRAVASTAVVAVAAVLVLSILVPAGAAKAAALRPFAGQSEEGLAGAYAFESTYRDRPFMDAVDAMELDGTKTVLTVDLLYAYALYPLAETAGHVYIDSAGFRSFFPLRLEPFAHEAERNGTVLLVQYTDFAFFHAINEAYGDCRTFDNGAFRVYEAWRCPGRLQALEQGYESRLPPEDR